VNAHAPRQCVAAPCACARAAANRPPRMSLSLWRGERPVRPVVSAPLLSSCRMLCIRLLPCCRCDAP
jgi:hypothetical protein